MTNESKELKKELISYISVYYDKKNLKEQNKGDVTFYSKCINYQPEPGHFYMFPSYLPHEYVLSKGGKFRFIHFNIQAIPTYMISNEGSV